MYDERSDLGEGDGNESVNEKIYNTNEKRLILKKSI